MVLWLVIVNVPYLAVLHALIRHGLPAVAHCKPHARRRATTESTICRYGSGFSLPTCVTIKSRLAVKIVPGRAQLVAPSEPVAELASSSLMASASPYALLVTWHRIQSPRPAPARTAAGRSFVCDRSENGNRTRITAPAAGGTTPH